MNIVIEGPDNSGKSTLAKMIASYTGRTIVSSEGPEKFPGEIDQRITRYFGYRDVIFDRHPVVSQAIYCDIVGTSEVDRSLAMRFYDECPIMVYCVGRPLVGHVRKAHDTDQHLFAITEAHDIVCARYDQWALLNARIIYRVGDRMSDVASLIKGAPHV